MNGYTGPSVRVAGLRRSFDEAFAAPARAGEAGLEPLLLIRAGGEDLALRSHHITGLARIGRILPIPSRIPELLGITAIRGALVPVFDLADLLGLHSNGAQPRWLALTAGETPAAFAFDQIEGQAGIPRADLYEYQASATREHIKEYARIGPAVRAVADIPAVVASIRRRAGLINPDKE